MLLACYRKDEAANPEIYAAAVEALLSEYSRDVVEYVTDPRTGMPSKSQWLPTVKEVRDACDGVVASIAASAARQRDLERQFEVRERYEAEQKAKKTTPTLAELEQKLGRKIAQRNDDELSEAQRAERDRLDRVASDEKLLTEYRELGMKPVMVGGLLVSPALLRQIEDRKKEDQQPTAIT